MSASEEARKLEERIGQLEDIVRRQGQKLLYFERLEDANADRLHPPTDAVRLPNGTIRFGQREV